VKLHTVAHVSI